MNYFKGITTLEELKKVYKKLVLENHPDRGGSLEVMQEINAEYEKAFKLLANNGTKENETSETFEEFKDVLNVIITLAGLDIEICGRWIWVSGNTYPYRAILKENGYRWASKKNMWYWRKDEDASNSRRHLSMAEIRQLHGSEKVSTSYRFALGC